MSITEDILVFTGNGERVNYYPQMRKGKMRYRGSKNSANHGRGFGGMKQVYYQSDEYYPISLLEFAAVARQHSLHPSQKPTELLEYLIRTYSLEGDTVLDIAMGSGSTIIAAAHCGRNAIGIEKDAAIFATAQKRIASDLEGLPLFA
jgi:site-specific DNA-methyltransferase (adenine-specific)